MKINKRIFSYFLICLIGMITFILIQFCKENPLIVEKIYSNYIFLLIARVLSKLFSKIPFSLWEFIYVGLLVFPVIIFFKFIYMLIKDRKNLKIKLIKHTKPCLITLLLGYFLFNILWGINYYREPIATSMGHENEQYKKDDLINLCKEVLIITNGIRDDLKEDINGNFTLSMEFSQLSNMVEDGYKYFKVGNKPLDVRYNNTKPVILSKFMSYTGITGMYSPFTGEANVNIDIPSTTLPVTIAHEQAHQRGIAREEEANYLAYLACVNSPNKELQYSGYYLALTYLMNDLYSIDKEAYQEIRKLYSHKLIRDINFSNNYWKNHEGFVERVWNKANDSYLKANNQSAGAASYGLMTKLLLGEYKSKIINK